ncbi:unnamed protein product [Linum trigynum]|uniref:Uncharacterized protein n=1 Tax=Linum trigynum TaxID=586398 RepID=A0AAV2CDS1_9ROSI
MFIDSLHPNCSTYHWVISFDDWLHVSRLQSDLGNFMSIIGSLFLAIVEYCEIEGCATLPDFSLPRPLVKLQQRLAAMKLLLVWAEYQDRRSRSGSVTKKADRRRHALLDLKVPASSSLLAAAVKRPRSRRCASLSQRGRVLGGNLLLHLACWEDGI